MIKEPGGITTISGHERQSRNVCPAFNDERLLLPDCAALTECGVTYKCNHRPESNDPVFVHCPTSRVCYLPMWRRPIWDAIARVSHAKTYYAYTDGNYSKPRAWFYTRIRQRTFSLFLQTQVFHAIRLGFQYPSGILTKKSIPGRANAMLPIAVVLVRFWIGRTKPYPSSKFGPH